MSDSNSPKAETESPNLLKNLRKFRFQRKTALNKMNTSDEDSNNSSFSDICTRRKIVNRIEDSDSDTANPVKPQTSGSECEKSEIKDTKHFAHIRKQSQQDSTNENGNINQAEENLETKNNEKRKIPLDKTYMSNRKRRKMNFEEDNDIDSDEVTYKEKIFDSDEDSDAEVSDELFGDKKAVFEFLQNTSPFELLLMANCREKRVDAIVECRPFKNWSDLVHKFRNNKHLDMEILNSAQDFLHIRKTINNIMKKCLRISLNLEKAVAAGSSKIVVQPSSMTKELKLTSYQMVGLNWLAVMHAHNVNAILADEMGLGKTVQVIAFLTYLKEAGLVNEDNGPHLLVVPSSTMENWMNELERWSPTLKVAQYYGSKHERKEIRMFWRRGGLDDIDVILTTYNLVISTPEERKLFRVLPIEYVVFDEAHMLKNMSTIRYENLIRINAKHRILLTGTPLQNNLVELMSLLIFVMPSIFAGIQNELKALFSTSAKILTGKNNDNNKPLFEQQQVKNAKEIMKPFVLRRLKADVLRDLPAKDETVIHCPMVKKQREMYKSLVAEFSAVAGRSEEFNGASMLMQLRKLANHPLLVRDYYTEDKLRLIASRLSKESSYKQKNPDYVFEDLLWMSDYQINQLTRVYKSLGGFGLPQHLVPVSGKFEKLDELLPKLKEENHRVLIFSQFTMVLDIMEEYLTMRHHTYLRLDGQTPVTERQHLIDEYTNDSSIFIFLLSTKAGGLGINLTAADTVIIHDIDYNPYNDKQAEDRCHRVGQTKPVKIIRFLSKNTIEEGMYEIAQEKLSLEQQVTGEEENENADKKTVLKLLKMTLGLDLNNKSLNSSLLKNGTNQNGFDDSDEEGCTLDD